MHAYIHTYITLHCIALHCIALHYTTYIHTYHHHRGIIPPPSHGGVGTRDTGPYIYIYTVYTELSSAMIDQMLVILYPQHIPKTGWFIQGGAPSLFTLESRTEVCKSTNITGGQHMATHYSYS